MSDPDANPAGEQDVERQDVEGQDVEGQDVERQREADPDAPGLGVVDDEQTDPPEPNEPA